MPGLGGVRAILRSPGRRQSSEGPHQTRTTRPRRQSRRSARNVDRSSVRKKKVVYGWATCDKTWVHIGKTQLAGPSAKIAIIVPSVPNHVGPPLDANLVVFGNGSQKFNAPVRLTVQGGTAAYEEPTETLTFEAVTATGRTVAASPPQTAPQNATQSTTEFAPAESGPATAEFESVSAGEAESFEVVPTSAKPAGTAKQPWDTASFVMHSIPMIMLGLVLVAGLAHDYFSFSLASSLPLRPPTLILAPSLAWDSITTSKGKARPSGSPIPSRSDWSLTMWPKERRGRKKAASRGATSAAVIAPSSRSTSKTSWSARNKSASGRVRLGNRGLTVEKSAPSASPRKHRSDAGRQNRPGRAVQVEPGNYKRLLDTCLVHYRIVNTDSKSHNVGLRIILDTYIGTNDGVPFTLPSNSKLVSTLKEFKTAKEVPDFIQALENPNLKDPGTILGQSQTGSKREAPDRVLLTRHPQPDAMEKWIVPLAPIKANDDGDSAVVLYWSPKELAAGATREVGFSIGRGDVSIGDSAKLGLTVGGSAVVRGELTAVALVADPGAQSATLELPAGLTLLDEKTQTQPVRFGKKGDDSSDTAPVTWRLRADQEGTFADHGAYRFRGFATTPNYHSPSESVFNSNRAWHSRVSGSPGGFCSRVLSLVRLLLHARGGLVGVFWLGARVQFRTGQ